PQKSGPGLGSVIAIILGAAAAVGVLYAAWQALRADDELWVADDPLSTPNA
ncbi:MAG: DNA helicase, partial [Microbacterium sp.]